MICVEPPLLRQHTLRVEDYDLAATLDSGQAFRWRRDGEAWVGVVGNRWVRLRQQNDTEPCERTPVFGEGADHGTRGRVRSPVLSHAASSAIHAEVFARPGDWKWLNDYLRTEVSLREILSQLPADSMLREAIQRHHGLRILRQDPWECLATFILSSTKQIVQIRQIVEALCAAHGDPIAAPAHAPMNSFPSAERIAALSEAELRKLKMGFRAAYLLEAAKRVSSGALDLETLPRKSLDEAREALMTLPGVGRKIADCVLLFSLGFDAAFPVDVWVMRVLSSEYFSGRKVALKKLVEFSATRFGPFGGYAQQYLFHHMRTRVSQPVRIRQSKSHSGGSNPFGVHPSGCDRSESTLKRGHQAQSTMSQAPR